MPNNICWIKLVFLILCLVPYATATLSDIHVESFVWYQNSRVFCLHFISDYDADELMQNISLHLTLAVLYKSNRQVVVNVGNHPCHKKSQRDLCGFIPGTVETSAFILPHLLSRHVSTTNQTYDKEVDITINISGSYGETAALSLGNSCDLYKDQCPFCIESCSSVASRMGQLFCHGTSMNKMAKTNRHLDETMDMPFDINVMEVFAFTERRLFCVVLQRPVHKLGNVWRYMKILPKNMSVNYTDEESGAEYSLSIPESDVCAPSLAMENLHDVDAFCASYITQPTYVVSLQGRIVISGYNLPEEIYTFEKSNVYISVGKTVSVRIENNPCTQQTRCSFKSCRQTCRVLVAENSFTCIDEIREKTTTEQNRMILVDGEMNERGTEVETTFSINKHHTPTSVDPTKRHFGVDREMIERGNEVETTFSLNEHLTPSDEPKKRHFGVYIHDTSIPSSCSLLLFNILNNLIVFVLIHLSK